MASGKITVNVLGTSECRTAIALLRQFVALGNQDAVPDEDWESLMAEAETFLAHGPLKPPAPADSDAQELADTNEHGKWYDEGYRDGNAEGLRHRLLGEPDHVPVGTACWCRPYRDTEDPDIIIHRPEAKA